MHKKILFSVFLLMTSLTALAKEPPNLAAFRQTLIQYHDSGEYQQDIAAVLQRAMIWLDSGHARAAKKHGRKPALVLDIDETALSNYADMQSRGFGGTEEDIFRAEAMGHDPAIAPILTLFRKAKAHGMAVFFITGRKERERKVTEKNLRSAGYHGWKGLFLKPNHWHGASTGPWKAAIRANLEKKGYTILLNIGDQYSDLFGGHAQKHLKLPNPWYFIP